MALSQYITVDEYLMGRATLATLSSYMVGNTNTIVPRVNQLLDRFGQYRKVTSGLRAMADHQRIYAEKNAQRKAQGLPPIPVPMSSKHLSCEACDLEDADGKFKTWLKTDDGLKAMEEIGLWQEDPSATPTWVHVQVVPPKSGKRVFMP
jgi:hypothetical protein